MKKILTVFKFEIGNYMSKSFLIPTIILCILCIGIMFFPRVKESFTSDGKADTEESASGEDGSDEEIDVFAIYDPNGYTEMTGVETIEQMFGEGKVEIISSDEEVKRMVENEEAKAGFSIKSLDSYDYYIFNKGMFDAYSDVFSEYMNMLVKYEYCQKNNLDVNEFFELEYRIIDVNEQVLGKDSTENYWYCYILVIIVFMLIIMYGTSIATGVANEKGNRSIEILVTTTSSNALLFGKVFAGVVASVFQVAMVAISLFGSYTVNKEYWGDEVANFLEIPGDVLLVFAIFGIGGFLIYAFMYGALGALVSKVEDLNKSAGTAQMLVMIVYFVVLLNLTNVDGAVIKVCSFLPISSYSAMFARVAMGNVETWEIVVSAIILYASVIGVGLIGGKIFRSSTLRYGNPIKLTAALKSLKKGDN